MIPTDTYTSSFIRSGPYAVFDRLDSYLQGFICHMSKDVRSIFEGSEAHVSCRLKDRRLADHAFRTTTRPGLGEESRGARLGWRLYEFVVLQRKNVGSRYASGHGAAFD